MLLYLLIFIIYEILSINESTVKMYLRKSLKILKKELKEDL